MRRSPRHASKRHGAAIGMTAVAACTLGLAAYTFAPPSTTTSGSPTAYNTDAPVAAGNSAGSAQASAGSATASTAGGASTTSASGASTAAAAASAAAAGSTSAPAATGGPTAGNNLAGRGPLTAGGRIQVPSTVTIPGTPDLKLPTQGGQAAIEIDGQGMIGTYGPYTSQQPIASVTKTMTAYLILKDHPLSIGQQGPILTLTQADVTAYEYDLTQDMSVVPVEAGEQITENEALQALMLPSANNMADILAAWDAGSTTAFVTKMNAEAKTLGMTQTVFTDDSGFDPGSASSSSDLLTLGNLVMQNTYFANLVDQESAIIPVAGTIYNVNTLLGEYGVEGIKTGSTSQAGGCLLFTAKISVNGLPVTLLGVVLGQDENDPNEGELAVALTAAKNLVSSAESSLVTQTLIPAGGVVASATPGAPSLFATTAVTVVGYPGEQFNLAVNSSGSTPVLQVTAPTGAVVAQDTLVQQLPIGVLPTP